MNRATTSVCEESRLLVTCSQDPCGWGHPRSLGDRRDALSTRDVHTSPTKRKTRQRPVAGKCPGRMRRWEQGGSRKRENTKDIGTRSGGERSSVFSPLSSFRALVIHTFSCKVSLPPLSRCRRQRRRQPAARDALAARPPQRTSNRGHLPWAWLHRIRGHYRLTC